MTKPGIYLPIDRFIKGNDVVVKAAVLPLGYWLIGTVTEHSVNLFADFKEGWRFAMLQAVKQILHSLICHAKSLHPVRPMFAGVCTLLRYEHTDRADLAAA